MKLQIRTTYRGFRMRLWLAIATSEKAGRDIYSYNVITPTGVEFKGTNYQPSPIWGDNKIKILDGLLHWICLRKGDTDQDYFKNYTLDQWQWANSAECEQVRSDLAEIEKTI